MGYRDVFRSIMWFFRHGDSIDSGDRNITSAEYSGISWGCNPSEMIWMWIREPMIPTFWDEQFSFWMNNFGWTISDEQFWMNNFGWTIINSTYFVVICCPAYQIAVRLCLPGSEMMESSYQSGGAWAWLWNKGENTWGHFLTLNFET